MADRPRTWTRNPDDLAYAERLRLPSFGINVARSDPSAVAMPTDLGTADLSPDSGDAFSASYLREGSKVSTANQDFWRLDLGYLRRILLRILGDEEYERILDHHYDPLHLPEFGEESSKDLTPPPSGSEAPSGSAARAQVRLTDLRLARDVRPADLRRELRSALPDLTLPLTIEGVLGWKWRTLRHPKEHRKPADLIENNVRSKKWYEEEQARIVAVSFAAAALLLLVDLNMRRLEEATRDALVGHVSTLATIVKDLLDKLDDSANELLGLLAGGKGGPGGRPSDPAVRAYAALILYRMGRPAEEIACRIGIISADQRNEQRKSRIRKKLLIRPKNPNKEGEKVPDPPKNWTSRLREFVKRGVEVEKEAFPRAAEVFDRKDEDLVRARAAEEFLHYLEAENWGEAELYVGDVGVGDDLLNGGLPLEDPKDEYHRAFVQLGSCLENGIDPLPESNVNFFS